MSSSTVTSLPPLIRVLVQASWAAVRRMSTARISSFSCSSSIASSVTRILFLFRVPRICLWSLDSRLCLVDPMRIVGASWAQYSSCSSFASAGGRVSPLYLSHFTIFFGFIYITTQPESARKPMTFTEYILFCKIVKSVKL